MNLYRNTFLGMFNSYRNKLSKNLGELNKIEKEKKNIIGFRTLNILYKFFKIIKLIFNNKSNLKDQFYQIKDIKRVSNTAFICNGNRDFIQKQSGYNINIYLSNLLYSPEKKENYISQIPKSNTNLIIFDSMVESKLWILKKNNPSLIVIDDVYIFYFFLKNPLIITKLIFSFLFKKKNISVFAHDYYLTFLNNFNLKIKQCLMLTSNSFKSELLRYYMPLLYNFKNIIEIGHGVPDVLTEAYIDNFYSFKDNRSSIKLTITKMLPKLIAHKKNKNVYPEKFYINLSFNKHLIKNKFYKNEIVSSVESGFKETFNDNLSSYKGIFISYFGGVPYDNDVIGSGMLKKEINLCNDIIKFFKKEKVDLKLIYFPHPSINIDFVNKHFSNYSIPVSRETFMGFYLSDLCISHYSTTLWEAKFFGSKIFSTAFKNNSFFSNEILKYISDDLSSDLFKVLAEIINKKNNSNNFHFRLSSRIDKLLNNQND